MRRDHLASHALDFWLTGEDLPDPDNRVLIDRDGGIRLHYRPNNLGPHEILTRKLRQLLNHIGCEPHLLPQNAYFGKKLPIAGTGHQNGTIRFGHDPRASALDTNCRAHEVDNLYVVDASFFPSSAAVNPTLDDHRQRAAGRRSSARTARRRECGAMIRLRILAFLCGLLLAAPLALGGPAVEAVSHVAIPVAQLDRAVSFYEAIGFVQEDEGAAGVDDARMRLGSERIVLTMRGGRPVPAGSRSNDLWFQHLAIVVSDIDRAYDIALRAGAVPISAGPQILPAWNPDAGGIRAVYFRDPGPASAGIDPVPARQRRSALAGEGPAVSRHRPHRDRRLRHRAQPCVLPRPARAAHRRPERELGRRTRAAVGRAGRACAHHDSCAPRAAPASNCCTIWPPATGTRRRPTRARTIYGQR